MRSIVYKRIDKILFDDMRLCRVQNFISVHKSGKKNSISYTKSTLRRFSNAKYQKKILV